MGHKCQHLCSGAVARGSAEKQMAFPAHSGSASPWQGWPVVALEGGEGAYSP